MRIVALVSLLLLAIAQAALGQPPNIPTLPPTIVTPDQPSPLDEPDANVPDLDLPAYPGLGQQSFGGGDFGGLDGITRGEKSLFAVPGLGTIVDRRQLDERQATDMFQTLQQEVGVLVQRTARGQSSPFIRGLTGQQVLILVDGVRMNNATFRAGANQYFNTIDPGQVERIEVLRGPQSVLYGSDAIGGAINVVTRSADRNRGAYRGGSFTETYSTADSGTYSRMNVEGISGNVGVFAGASYLNVRDLDRGGDQGRQPFTNYDQYAGDVKIDRLLDDDHILTVGLQHFEQTDVPRSDRFAPFSNGPPFNAPRPTFFDPQQRDLAYLRLQGLDPTEWTDAYTLTASYGRQKEGSREIRSSTRTDLGQFDVETVGVSVVGVTELDRRMADYMGKLTYGLDWYHDDVDAFKNRFNPTNGSLAAITPQFPDDSFYQRIGTFLTWDVPLTSRLELTSGVRYEHIDAGGTPIVVVNNVNTPVHITPSYSDWIGNVGLSYELTPCWRLVGSIAEGFRAPNLDDLVATNSLVQQAGQDIPTTDLQPEHSVNYEVGVKLDAQRLRSQAFVFWTDLGDNIVRTQAAAGLFQRANQDSYLNGVEWYGEYLLANGWNAYGNFAYTYGQNLEANMPLSRIPPTQGVLGLRWRDEQSRHWFDTYAWLVRKQDRLNFQDLTDSRIPPGGTPGFQTLNFRVGTTLGESCNHQCSLSLENIFDQAYRVHGSGVEGPGFNAILSYAYHR
jgi:outer membrane receptor protein involved in Fe transport